MDIDTIFAQDITATGTITGATLIGGSIRGNDLLLITEEKPTSVNGFAYIRTMSEGGSNGSMMQKVLRLGVNHNVNSDSLVNVEQVFTPENDGLWNLLLTDSSGNLESLMAQPGTFGITFAKTVVYNDLDVHGTINGCKISRLNTLGGSFVHGGSVALDSSSNGQNWAQYHPSFAGSIKDDGTWYNYISVRHQNGQGDGAKYGMRFWSNLHNFGDLRWQQQVNSWGTEKVIVDNSNISKYLPTAAPGTKGGAQMLSGHFTMNAIDAGKYDDKTYKFSSGTFSGTPSGVVCVRNASPGTSVSGNTARSVVLTGTTKTSISVRAYNNSTSSWTPDISYILIYRG